MLNRRTTLFFTTKSKVFETPFALQNACFRKHEDVFILDVTDGSLDERDVREGDTIKAIPKGSKLILFFLFSKIEKSSKSLTILSKVTLELEGTFLKSC